jgi:hypothetical protein
MPGRMCGTPWRWTRRAAAGSPRFVLADRIGHVDEVGILRGAGVTVLEDVSESGMPAVSETIVREYL